MPPRVSCRAALAAALLAFTLAGAAQAATLKLALLMQADDPRLDPKRTELAYPGQPGGPLSQAVEMALAEAQFELDAAKLTVEFATVEASDAADARSRLQQIEKDGAAAVLLDLPADWATTAAAAVKLPLLNAGSADDELRGAACRPNLFHTLPGERMRTDALAQTLMARKWARVLLLHGPSAEDAARLAVVQASLKRYGLKTIATKPWKLSADPRERELANPLLLTGGADHDVVWVVDSDGEFARTLPYRTALPRPVVGDAGLTAQAWGPHFERFGAPQLTRRFARAAKRPMTGHDWAAWMATKAVLQAAIAGGAAPNAAQMMKAMASDGFVLDAFKGTRVSFRAWDRQLRQPLLLTDGVGILAIAPVEGVLHPKNVLDTLGADERESACKAK
jgi:ABC transporter substrate binding protein (PQQ-dependent alcohol dehydrogenase system)